MELVKYILAVAVGAFAAGIGAIQFLDGRIKKQLGAYSTKAEADARYVAQPLPAGLTPESLDKLVADARSRLSWQEIKLDTTDDFDKRCAYRFAYRNTNRDVAIEYATEVAGKTLSGSITDKRFFNVGAESKKTVLIAGTDEQKGSFNVEWIQAQCN